MVGQSTTTELSKGIYSEDSFGIRLPFKTTAPDHDWEYSSRSNSPGYFGMCIVGDFIAINRTEDLFCSTCRFVAIRDAAAVDDGWIKRLTILHRSVYDRILTAAWLY